MSHWTTSGRDRLRAAQRNSFGQRAHMRANVVAPEWIVLPGHHPSGQATPSHQNSIAHRKVGTKAKYSYGNPIARRGKVVQIGASRPPNLYQNAMPSPTMCHPSFVNQTRRIRDPMAARYMHHSPRTIPQGQQMTQVHLGHGGTGSAQPALPSGMPQITDYHLGPIRPSTLYSYPLGTRMDFAPLTRPHAFASHEYFDQEYEILRGEGGWRDSSTAAIRVDAARTMPQAPLLNIERSHIPEQQPAGFQRFRKQGSVDDFFGPLEFPWEEPSMAQTYGDSCTVTGSRSFGYSAEPTMPFNAETRTQISPVAKSHAHNTLSGRSGVTPEARVPALTTPPHRSFSSVAGRSGTMSHVHEYPGTPVSHQQSSVKENNWEILPEIPPAAKNRQLAAFNQIEPFSVNQYIFPYVENMGGKDSDGLSRFQVHSQERSSFTANLASEPDKRARTPKATESNDFQSHPTQHEQLNHDFGTPPPLRFFNEGVEIDLHGRPLSRPGSQSKPDSSKAAENKSLHGTFSHEDESWKDFF